MSEKQQRKDEAGEESSGTLNDILRLIAFVTLIGIGVCYYYFNTPMTYAPQEMTGRTMGTDYQVKIHDFPVSKNSEVWPTFQKRIQARLDEIDAAMSTYKSDSEVSRFNASKSTDWFDVSAETAKVVGIAQTISELSDGAFDVTISPLVDLWGFGPNIPGRTLEELEKKTEELKNRIGYKNLEVRFDPPGLKKAVPELTIDLSAVAKGYAVDCVAELLEENKFVHYMVEVGGEVRCRGSKGESGDWIIGIEKPLIVLPGEFPGYQRKFPLGDNALATSGDYQNFREVGGVRFSHIIDPRTGAPTIKIPQDETVPEERLGSVSVIDKTCVRADALATALFVLGEEKGLQLAEKQGIAVLFLVRTGRKDEPVREAFSTVFPKKVDP